MQKLFYMLLSATWCVAAAAHATDAGAAGGLYPVTLKQVEGAVSQALQQKGAGEVINAYIIGRRTTVMYHTVKPVALEVKTLDFNPTAGKWSANILFVAGQEVLSALPLSGRYDEMTNLPVVKKQLHAGDVIRREDIAEQAFAKQRIRQDTITEAAALIGKAPRRAISAGRPIRADEIQNPRIMEKGAVVEMRYNTPYINIRTVGEAMDEGAVGDVISVRNQTSRKIIQATIVGPGEVSVSLPGGELAKAAAPPSLAGNTEMQELFAEEDPYNERL